MIERKNMSANKRQEKIIEIVGKKGKIQVEELANLLQVSSMTVRRDLTSLEEKGILERVHGAAVMKKETEYSQKIEKQMAEKQAIAEICVGKIKSGDTIFLDAGTTTLEIAKRILDIPNLIIVTNDIDIAFLVHQCSNLEVMCCGGSIQKETGSIFGVFANQMMNHIQLDKAFIGAASINYQYNVLTPTIDKASLKRLVVNSTDESYLVVDQSKFNKKALMKINNLKDYTGVITTKKFGKIEMEKIRNMGIHIITATVSDSLPDD